eukprot:249407-Lingulodinium_polyedra.AAC.1
MNRMGDDAPAMEHALCQGLCAVVERYRMEQLADGYDLTVKPVFLPLSVRSYPPLFDTRPEYRILSELPPFDMEA